MLLGGAADFGLFNLARARLNSGIQAAGQYAFLTGTGVTAAKIQSLVTAASGLSGLTFNVHGPACYCVTGTSPSLVLTAQASNPGGTGTLCTDKATYSGVACPDGVTTSSYYAVIQATYAYPAIMPLYSNFVGATATYSATVPLQ